MSSRAFRRLQQSGDVIKVKAGKRDEQSDDLGVEDTPAFVSNARKKDKNPFALLEGSSDGHQVTRKVSDSDESGEELKGSSGQNASQQKSRRKRRKKKGKAQGSGHQTTEGRDEVDAAVEEVNKLLGGKLVVPPTTGAAESSRHSTRPLLTVDKRFLNANAEMKRIFGSSVVRAEQRKKVTHSSRSRRVQTILAVPRDTWPKMDKPGLTMTPVEYKDGCQWFAFEHSPAYQKVQCMFWDAVETFDPNSIASILNKYPYHIDSLLQLSEVCRMGEDVPMAAELIERTLYCFERCFHTLFNISQGNCRLSYSRAENRPFFIALFRHIYYTGRQGCHRTALEFSKLLLSLDPEADPLCALLVIDYFAIRAGEYRFLLELFNQWEKPRNLSQLPNFSFSVPLAMFHSARAGGCQETSRADELLQQALIQFPSLLLPLMDKCGVMVDAGVRNHHFYSSCDLDRDPTALRVLIKLYIERSHSLWKEPEVISWLEQNCRQVIVRVDSKDPLVEICTERRSRRYVGTPANVCRHVVVSEFEQVVAALPKEVTSKPITMYDPLPPEDSVAGYSRPERVQPASSADESLISLFLRSLLPSFNLQAPVANPQPRRQQPPGGAGAEGGGTVGTPSPALNLHLALEQLTQSLHDLVAQLRAPLGEGEGEELREEGSSDDDDDDGE